MVYESYDGDFNALVDRVTGVDPPDVVIAPWWILRDMSPDLEDLTDFVNGSVLDRDFGTYLIDAATVEDGVFGAPIRVDLLKSLVWYKPDVFATSGDAIPETFAELVALSDRIVADSVSDPGQRFHALVQLHRIRVCNRLDWHRLDRRPTARRRRTRGVRPVGRTRSPLQ